MKAGKIPKKKEMNDSSNLKDKKDKRFVDISHFISSLWTRNECFFSPISM